MNYEIKITRKAQKELAKIPEPYQTKIIDKIYSLKNDPYYNSKKLVGRDGYRIRIGDYRIIYEIKNNELVILVIHIGHRKDVYEK